MRRFRIRRVLAALAAIVVAGSASTVVAQGCTPHPSRSEIASLSVGHAMTRAVTLGFGAYESTSGAPGKSTRADLSLPRPGHFTSGERPQALVLVRELDAASGDLTCRAVVLEPEIAGDHLAWSRMVLSSDPDPRLCGRVDSVVSDDGMSQVILSGDLASGENLRLTIAVRFDGTTPVFGPASVVPATGPAADAQYIVDDERRVIRAVASGTSEPPDWDRQLMTALEREWGGTPPEGQFDRERRMRVFTDSAGGTLLAIRARAELMGLTTQSKQSVVIGAEGAVARPVLVVMD